MAMAHHIAINCIDRLAMEEFYHRHFGFERVRVFNAGGDDEFVMTRQPGGNICLEFHGGADSPADTNGPVRSGVRHICFEVDDLEPIVEQIESAGVKTKGIKDASRHFPSLRVCFLDDPEGNSIELLQGWQDEENPPPAPTG